MLSEVLGRDVVTKPNSLINRELGIMFQGLDLCFDWLGWSSRMALKFSGLSCTCGYANWITKYCVKFVNKLAKQSEL